MSDPFAAKIMTPRILWGALCFSVVLFDVALTAVRDDKPPGVPPHLDLMLAAMSVGLAIMSVGLPRQILVRGIKAMNLEVEERPGEAIGGFRESAPVTRVVKDPTAAIGRAFAPFQQALLIGMALAESIALFGFMLGFLGENMLYASLFFVASLLLMITKYPRIATLATAVERATGARCSPP
jgi:F0F1-type ATP synthase membrane subunit c/vacuolar-type H+-ATPase subunit K